MANCRIRNLYGKILLENNKISTWKSDIDMTFLIIGGGQAGYNGIAYENTRGSGAGGKIITGTTTLSTQNITIGIAGLLNGTLGGNTILGNYNTSGGTATGLSATAFNSTGKNGFPSSISGSIFYYGASGSADWYATLGETGGGRGDGWNGFSFLGVTSGSFYGAGGGAGACSTGNNKVSNGGNGYQGVAIIRYTSATNLATGGTITTVGGDKVHTFTSDGTFTLI